jgi:hypothetical protein
LNSNLYQFPATRFVSNSLWRQWWHLLSEVLELGRALFMARFTGDLQHVAREAEDVSQSDETFKRILSGEGVDIAMARAEVIAGCLERGYYE